MEPKEYKKIELENNQTLVILDMSRKISEDAYVVRMTAQIDVQINPALFDTSLFPDPEITKDQFDQILSVLGDKVTYEYSIERNFVMAEDKASVFNALVETFMKNLGKYVAKPQFPGKLVLKEYNDKIK